VCVYAYITVISGVSSSMQWFVAVYPLVMTHKSRRCSLKIGKSISAGLFHLVIINFLLAS